MASAVSPFSVCGMPFPENTVEIPSFCRRCRACVQNLPQKIRPRTSPGSTSACACPCIRDLGLGIPIAGVFAHDQDRKREGVLYQGVQCGPDYDLSVLGNRAVLGSACLGCAVHGRAECATLEKEIFFGPVPICTLIGIQHA